MTDADVVSLLSGRLDGEALTKLLEGIGGAVTRESEDDGEQLLAPDAGVEVHADRDGNVHTIMFIVTPNEDSVGDVPFPGALPFGLQGATTPEEVRARVGQPPKFSSEEHNAWDFDEYRLVSTFEEDEVLDITITTSR